MKKAILLFLAALMLSGCAIRLREPSIVIDPPIVIIEPEHRYRRVPPGHWKHHHEYYWE